MYDKTKIKYYSQGIISFEDLEKKADLNEGQQLQVAHEVHDLPARIDPKQIKAELDSYSYPLYFLDFETFAPAIPLYENSSPY